jgi:DNA repair protein RadC
MQTLMIKSGTRYRRATPVEIAEAAGHYAILSANRTRPSCTAPRDTAALVQRAIGGLDYEVFCVLLLDNRHRLIELVDLFRGTIDGASVHPREVVKLALMNSAAAVVFAHNHPSGNPSPSQADELITTRLRDALALIDVRVLDHLIVTTGGYTSFAERGLI